MATKGTKKTTTSKKPATVSAIEEVVEVVENKINEEVVQEESKVEIQETPKVEVKKPRVYKEDDTIVCRSITRGELIYIGGKSESKYIFGDFDDTTEVEVRDLNFLKARKSGFLYKPLFVIEDEEFMQQPKWKDLKDLYDQALASDIDEIISKPLGEFTRILASLPTGYKDAVVREIATRIHNDEFDSLKKIKATDEICGTDLYCLIS